MSDTAQQLELIINMLKAQSITIEETKANLAAYQAKVTVLEAKVTTLEFTVDDLSADVLSLKEQLNTKNQEGKLNKPGSSASPTMTRRRRRRMAVRPSRSWSTTASISHASMRPGLAVIFPPSHTPPTLSPSSTA